MTASRSASLNGCPLIGNSGHVDLARVAADLERAPRPGRRADRRAGCRRCARWRLPAPPRSSPAPSRAPSVHRWTADGAVRLIQPAPASISTAQATAHARGAARAARQELEEREDRARRHRHARRLAGFDRTGTPASAARTPQISEDGEINAPRSGHAAPGQIAGFIGVAAGIRLGWRLICSARRDRRRSHPMHRSREPRLVVGIRSCRRSSRLLARHRSLAACSTQESGTPTRRQRAGHRGTQPRHLEIRRWRVRYPEFRRAPPATARRPTTGRARRFALLEHLQGQRGNDFSDPSAYSTCRRLAHAVSAEERTQATAPPAPSRSRT